MSQGETAQAVHATSAGVVRQGGNVYIAFGTPDGIKAYGIDHALQGRLIEGLITEASKEATSPHPGSSVQKANPIPVARMSIVPHPHDPSSGILAVMVGNVPVTFQVDMTMLTEAMTHLAQNTTSEPRSSH